MLMQPAPESRPAAAEAAAGTAGAPPDGTGPTERRWIADPAAIVLAALGLIAGAAAVGGELLLRRGIELVPVPVTVLDASMSWLLLAAAVARAAWLRIPRETPTVAGALRRLRTGLLILLPALAAAPFLPDGASLLPLGLQSVLKLLALPFLLLGLLGLAWPRRFSRTAARIVVADSLVGCLGVAVLWYLTLLPVARQWQRGADPWAVVNAVTVLLAGCVLLILVAAARTRALVPFRQLALLHGMVACYLAAGILDLQLGRSGVTAVSPYSFFALIGAALVVVFLLSPSRAAETGPEKRLRELYSAVVPLAPIPLAGLAVVVALLEGPAELAGSQLLGALLLLWLLGGVVVLRALASAELREAGRTQAANQLRAGTEEEWFQALVGRATDLVLVLHRNGTIAYASPSVSRATAMDPADLRGRSFRSLLRLSVADRDVVALLLAQADAAAGAPTEPRDLVLQQVHGDGRDVEWQVTALQGLDIDGYLVNGRDVTEDRRMRALIAESATRDPLTGLLSREGFLAETTAVHGPRCILVLNLRRFASFNDQHGHPAGDHMLRTVAAMLRELRGPVSAPARLSADTFATLITGVLPEAEAVSATAALRSGMRAFILPDGRPLPLDVAAGYAADAYEELPMSELLGRAELAMAHSRVLERSPLVKFDASLRLARAADASAEADLRSALRDRELVVLYQPIVRLTDGAVVGVEALVRRLRSDGSLESPEAFIPLAERLGLVDEVDHAVLLRALADIDQVGRATGRQLPVSVNISASELDDSLEHRVLDALGTTGRSGSDLIIEVTETALTTRAAEAQRLLRRLQQHGCQIAMDDFGTGYSSMAGLVDMPVDILKIDASFTHRLTAAGRGLSVMRAIVEIGRSLNLTTVAEGLATVEQADLLRGMGCDRGQGYLFAPPLSAEDLVEFLSPGGQMMAID
jgi:diguanylate cyclase (GGDEF)-like protein/PAS domain S-box-containing protein